ncbi:MAG: hypothetical protein LKF43_11835 [Streptococcaceae bacterium]|jgi:hypothetical protein|nr:hypothetical protein [Streptococcaceae bacterium]
MKKESLDYKVIELVTRAYLNNGAVDAEIDKQKFKIELKKRGEIDYIKLFINTKQKAEVEVNHTKSRLIFLDEYDSNAIKYVLPFIISLGLKKDSIKNYKSF